MTDFSDSSLTQPPRVACPTCTNPSLFAPSNTWRPFCSQRCKLIDIGHWANESFRLPSQDSNPDPEPTA